MCGIGGAIDTSLRAQPALGSALAAMNELQRHRGPDGDGIWIHPRSHVGFAHRRLSIIDLDSGRQPMHDGGGNWLTFNGEIYNYRELRSELGSERFRTQSDTEVILHAYRRWGRDCLSRFRGMFAFALWDEEQQRLFCARDRFGIKPLYYTQVGTVLYFASEIKALLPFIERAETNVEALADYLTFQFCLEGKTLFQDVHELLPGHWLEVAAGKVRTSRYWQVYYNLDFATSGEGFEEQVSALLGQSVDLHLRSDVPVGAYLSGGLDSSLITSLATERSPHDFQAFIGKFLCGEKYDESHYARELANSRGVQLHEIAITAQDFIDNVEQVVYHLDQPVAGPGSFAQFMVSQLAAKHRKVVLGGQGADEIFGGYTRYLIAYFEQCIRGAIDGTMNSKNFIVTYESIIPNLASLRSYKPLLQSFWSEGLFGELDERYFRLINRAPQLADEIDWPALGGYQPFDAFRTIFRAPNVPRESYFDCMTHFDFKTLLPALLQVEDRVSMAHGLESRVPFLDHALVELAATIPPNIKFRGGEMKHLLRKVAAKALPSVVLDRKDKMGFPVPLNLWINGEARDFVHDIFTSTAALARPIVNNRLVAERLGAEGEYSRQAWGLLCLELWQRRFCDRHAEFRRMASTTSLDPRSLVTPADELLAA